MTIRPITGKRFLAVLAASAIALAACSGSGATTSPSAPGSSAPAASAAASSSAPSAAPASSAPASASPASSAPASASAAASAPASATGLKAVYVSTGPIGVNPFLQLISDGLTRAGKDCGVQTSVVESKDTTAMADNLRQAIEDKADLVIANSFDSVDAVTALGKQFPSQKWATVDTGIADNPNVRGLVFQEHEGTYLIGVIFGLLSSGNYAGFPKSDVIGAVGAIDQPFVRRWYVGFEEGVKSVNPGAKVLLGWANGFNDPAGSKELALAQFNQGAKYIFSFSAAGNTGIFEAAKEKNFFTSGVDTDQRVIDPAHILESMVKRTDVGVYDAVCDLAKGSFTGGFKAYGLKERGVGPAFLVLDNLNPPSVLPQEVQDKVKTAAADIVSGKIKVTDFLAK